MPTSAGTKRHKITIQQRSTTRDAVGQQSQTWSDAFPAIWAHISPMSARELMAAQAVQSEASHTIVVRYRPEFANPTAVTAYRAVYGARIFNIHGCMNVDERNVDIELMASEGMDQG